MSEQYRLLFSPGRIGPVTVKNRAIMSPAMTGFPGLDGEVGDRVIQYYAARAKGGVGLIITEAGTVDEKHSLGRHNQLYYTLRSAAGLERLCEAVHRYDTRIFAQLWHGGNLCDPSLTGQQAVSASDVPATPGNIPRPLCKDEIDWLIGRYAQAASICKRSGYDGVEIHAAHGCLIPQFLSRYFNKRSDEYGGPFENRVRLLREILEAVRHTVGPRYPISVRFSADEMASGFSPDHMNYDDGLRLAKYLDASGLVDVLNVSNCNRLTPNANCDPYFYQQGWKQHLAQGIKAAVSIPTIATNTIKTPEQAECQLADGISDFVAMTRAMFADPDFMRKTSQGRESEIVNCIGCLVCRESMGAAGTLCSVNPQLGYEAAYSSMEKNGGGRPVAVVGGGPAGMKAATVLAQRGFAVTLYEQSDKLGGTLNIADKPHFKDKLTRLNHTLQTHMELAGVKVLLGVNATVELLHQLDPVGIFVAGGASPVVPNIPGVALPHVYTAEQILCGERPSGKVAVIGTGLTGLETAEMLAMNGSVITLVEMLPEIGPGLYAPILQEMKLSLEKYSPALYTEHQLVGITKENVSLKCCGTGEIVQVEVDSVVLALGVRPRHDLAEAFRSKFRNVVVVGDAEKGGRIYDAIKTGFCKAFAFNPC